MLINSFRKIFCTILILFYILITAFETIAEDAEPDYSELQLFNVIEFGQYEQDGNLENGPEPIEWIVLKIEEKKILLISRYGLDAIQFHNKTIPWDNPVNWKMSSIRKWLNQDFYEKAFSVLEKEYIESICINNDPDLTTGSYHDRRSSRYGVEDSISDLYHRLNINGLITHLKYFMYNYVKF